MKIIGIEGLNVRDVEYEVQRGGRFVIYQYCISALVMSFKRPSAIYFLKLGESDKSLKYTAISLLLGWWGIPWGPIWTISAAACNLRGGKDVTEQMLAAMNQVEAHERELVSV
jgi:hypothetical protein